MKRGEPLIKKEMIECAKCPLATVLKQAIQAAKDTGSYNPDRYEQVDVVLLKVNWYQGN